MAVPNKKMYDRSGKLVFDPSNPEDVRNYKEKQPLIEALKLVQGLTDPRGGSGFVGMARGISKAFGAKAAKALFKQNKAKQFADLVTKPMTKGKKSVPKTTPTVKEVVETKPDIPTTIPSTMELAQIPGSSAKTVKEGIKSFTGKTEKFVSKDPRLSSGKLQPFKDKKGLTEPDKLGVQNYGSGFTTMEYKAIDPSKALSSKPMKDIVREDMLKALKVSAGIGAAGAGVILGTDYLRGTFSPESVRKTNLSKTGPIDLKRINKNNLKDSSIPGVKKITAIVNGEEKEFSIVWDNKTQSWDYYRGDKTKKTTENKQQQEKVRGGGYIPIDNTDKNKGNNQSSGTNTGGSRTGGGTKPRSATGQSFDKAFAEARKQAGGAGGIFEWNGKKYGTALVGETVPKDRVEVGKTTTPVTIKNEYPTAESDPTLEIAMQQDSIRQQMATKPLPTKPLSSLVFKTTSESINKRNTMDEQNALRSIIADNRTPLKKKRYGGNLAMLKYMK